MAKLKTLRNDKSKLCKWKIKCVNALGQLDEKYEEALNLILVNIDPNKDAAIGREGVSPIMAR